MFPNPMPPLFRRPQTFQLVPYTKLSVRYPDGERKKIEKDPWESEKSGTEEACPVHRGLSDTPVHCQPTL